MFRDWLAKTLDAEPSTALWTPLDLNLENPLDRSNLDKLLGSTPSRKGYRHIPHRTKKLTVKSASFSRQDGQEQPFRLLDR